MGIREELNTKPWVAVVALVLGIALLVYMVSRREVTQMPLDKTAFFTADDGKTWFKADAGRIPPFEHEGKTAYRAFVFRCGGKEFVAYMQKYSPAGKKSWEEKLSKLEGDAQYKARDGLARGGEFKGPGEKNWFNPQANMAAAGRLMSVKCPDGKPADYVEP